MGSSPPAADDDRYQGELWKHPTHATLLVSDADAGRVIGRRGSAVAGVESTSRAQVRLSRRGQFLPGTDSRILLVSGLFHQVMDAAELILNKIVYQVIHDRSTVVLVVPDACCGTLIGKGGTVIKSLAIASNAGIVVSPQDVCYGLNDRLVTITGHLDNQLQAIFLILSELLEDDRYSCSYAGVPFPYPVSSVGFEDHGPDEHVERYHSRPKTPMRSPDNNDDDAQEFVTIAIADEHIGPVIGRGGKKIKEILMATDAWIQTSAKGDFIAGTNDMEVVISGTREAVDAAETIQRKQQRQSTCWSEEFLGGHSAGYCAVPSESWTEYDELIIEDGQDAYFKGLVDRFIAAAYSSGMNGVMATGPGQREAATSPGASSRSTEARAARQVAELEGGEVVVSTSKTVITRMVLRERYTWKYQITEDGPQGLMVLSHIKRQLIRDSCLPTALAAVIESNLSVQRNKDTLLSLEYLIHLSNAGRIKFPDEKASVDRLIFMARDEGVLSEEDFEKSKTATGSNFVRYYITKYYRYMVDNLEHMRHALYKMRSGGPLMGVIKISKNYDDCFKSGKIYKYDQNLEGKDEAGNPTSITHAVCVISFAIENGVPYLECQDSHGERSGNKGFLKIDVTSLSNLWSIAVA